MKRCSTCKWNKPLDAFHKNKATRDGLQNVCTDCYRQRWGTGRYRQDHNLRILHGITLAQFEEQLEAQGGVCFLCGRPPAKTSAQTSRLHVDHNHETEQRRALLCHNCNLGLGNFQDDPDLLRRAAIYLEDGSGWDVTSQFGLPPNEPPGLLDPTG